MKIAIIFPFFRTKDSPFDGPPLSTPLLVDNIKGLFHDVFVEQIDLNQELLAFVRGGIFLEKVYVKVTKGIKIMTNIHSPLMKSVRGQSQSYKQMTDNRLTSSCYIPTDEDLYKFKDFLEKFVRQLKLEKFDHYFLTIYKAHEPDMIASMLLARFLKKKFPEKKIIYGGLRNFSQTVYKKIEKLEFIDALVVGPGKKSLQEIVGCLNQGKNIKKIYNILPRPEEVITLPDYKSFRHLEYFRHKKSNLEKEYGINIKGSAEDNILYIPYRFSTGCFWGKCLYCASANKQKYYSKTVDEIVNDLKKLKEICRTKYFIFYNNNFNSNLNFTKKLLKAFIKNKLDILWTDSFNMVIFDDEIIDLLPRAGCIRVDLGASTLNPKLQKFYNNILQNNKYLDNLRKIHNQGIWVDINIIANLPYSYSVIDEIKILKKYLPYIDAVTLNSYRAYYSEMVINARKYKLTKIDKGVRIGDAVVPMFFKENECTDIEKRKKMYAQNYLDWHKFLISNKVIVNQKLFYLLGCLYNNYGHKNKTKIKKQMLKAGGYINNKHYSADKANIHKAKKNNMSAPSKALFIQSVKVRPV